MKYLFLPKTKIFKWNSSHILCSYLEVKPFTVFGNTYILVSTPETQKPVT